MTNEQEKLLVSKLRAGEENAYRYLFENYYNPLCRVALFYVEDPYVAENLAEDLFAFLWEQRSTLVIHSSLRSYLFTAIRHRSLNYLQQAYTTNKVSLSEESVVTLLASSDSSPLGLLIEKELEEKINSCIDQLPQECRKVFNLSRIEGLSYEAIAAEVGISLNTVRYHIKNALATLRQKLKENMTFF
jgi:RNA polymerase sigma-70 factor (ECF subfamily)